MWRRTHLMGSRVSETVFDTLAGSGRGAGFKVIFKQIHISIANKTEESTDLFFFFFKSDTTNGAKS
jgi:hypothetical protein